MSKSISLPFLQKPRALKLQPPSLKKNTQKHASLDVSPKSISPNVTESFYLNSPREHPVSQNNKVQIGIPAKLDFINTYRNRIKLTDKNTFERKESTVSMAYLEVIDKRKLKPMSFGIIRKKGRESDLNLEGYNMGDNYAEAFSEGIKHYKSLERVNLKSNRLSEKGLTSIIGKLEIEKIKHLCLSDNNLSIKVVKQISETLTDLKCSLKHLILESAKLSDNSAVIIFESLALNASIKHLNLAQNSLTDNCTKTLKSMISLNTTLKKLDLHWNKFTGPGCAQIFEGLKENYILNELDLSWNLMSRDIEGNSVQKIAEILSSQEFLKHLDLSSNYLNTEQCSILAKGLEKNHSLIGLHITGNDCHIDSKGFIHPDKYINKVEKSHLRSRMFNEKKHKAPSFENCWLCENWVEMKFNWTGEASEPVCIHLECDDFQPDLMSKEHNFYSITRVVPAGKVRFFFSVNLVIVKAKDMPVSKIPMIEKEIEFWNASKVKLPITNLNEVEAKGNAYNLTEKFLVTPRTASQSFQPVASDLEKIPWKYSSSLFKNYITDHPDLIADCFEFDWKNAKISNILKDLTDLERTKKVLFKHYQAIKEGYRYLASYSVGEVPGIGSNLLSEFLSQSKVFDSLYEPSYIGVDWNASLSQSSKGQAYNPGNVLVRHEFLEILVRVAYEKYFKKKICYSLAEATEKLIEGHLLQRLEAYNSSRWRENEYHCEIIDVTLKAHKILLESLFSKYSGRKSLPGQKPFMSIEEFRDLCTDAKIVNDKFSSREIDLCFYLSIMTQVDELSKKRHTEMRFCEFLEAITRAADLADIRKPSEELVMADGKNRSLKEKIENVCLLLVSVCPSSVQDVFVFPTEKTYEKLMYKPKGSIYRSTTLNLLDVSY